MGDLSERFSKERLIEVAGIVVKVRMGDVFFMASSPVDILSVLPSLDCRPLLEERHLLPQPIPIDLAAQTKLYVEAATFDVLLQNILPHKANAA
jgi:hypothetical protein